VADLGLILNDLAAESHQLDELVSGLRAAEWATATPAEGWTIAHQIGHLAWTDAKSLIAVTTPEEFPAEIEKAVTAGDDYVSEAAEAEVAKPPDVLLDEWRRGRADLAAALAEVPQGQKIPWYGPPMSAASMATARLMETWAHGQDVYDALGRTHPAGPRLRHIVRFGTRTRDFAFLLRSLAPPAEEFRVELRAPDGGTWAFGPEDADERVTGGAVDFCLLITQRRHPEDTDLRATGPHAREWLGIAQAFAGPPGNGRKAGQFS
jgi:uncharacterized protein (TIGR03084 family)